MPLFSPSFLKSSLIVCSIGGALLLSACGGGGDNDETNTITRLFPNDVMTGKVAFSGDEGLTITPTYKNRDWTQGFASYSYTTNEGGDHGSFNNMNQIDADPSGRLVFRFDSDRNDEALEGLLTIRLTESNDAGHTRTGTVESGDISSKNNNGSTKYNLTGATVTITW